MDIPNIPILSDALALTWTASYYVIQTEIETPEPGQGEAKKAKVVSDMRARINAPGGLDFPGWVSERWQGIVLDKAIDFTVWLINRFGGQKVKDFFASLRSLLPTS